MTYRIQNFDQQAFLQQFWQKQPTLIRQMLPGFIDPLDEHELAGIAQEEDADSRIVQFTDDWRVAHGPFEDFSDYCHGKWSLLVQGTDRYVPEAKALFDAFDFIPSWRKEDLMASFSVADSGVGPHLDQYDVFIIQGKGSRRWQVGSPGQYREIVSSKDLRHVEQFEPVIDEVLYPGDVLYIPPGAPHNGVALEPCMNYSVGFRAPSQSELISGLADFALAHQTFNQRFTDTRVADRLHAAELTREDIDQFRSLITKALNSNDFSSFLGEFLSRGQENFGDLLAQSDSFTTAQIKELLDVGTCFVPTSDHRHVLVHQCNDDYVLYISEFSLPVKKDQIDDALALVESEFWPNQHQNEENNSLFFVQLLTTLTNAGLWRPA